VSEKLITWQQLGLVERHKSPAGTRISPKGPALAANSLCTKHNGCILPDLEVQIENFHSN
jgi:hypothetical protein